MVEALDEKASAAAAAASTQDDDNLIGGPVGAALKVPAALDGNDSYEETPMNMNGFFCDNDDQVSNSSTSTFQHRNL